MFTTFLDKWQFIIYISHLCHEKSIHMLYTIRLHARRDGKESKDKGSLEDMYFFFASHMLCRCIVELAPSLGAMVRLRAWGRSVAELIGGGGDKVLPRFRLAGEAPYFLQDPLYRGE